MGDDWCGSALVASGLEDQGFKGVPQFVGDEMTHEAAEVRTRSEMAKTDLT